MKLLLINPPQFEAITPRFKSCLQEGIGFLPPYGLMSLASSVREKTSARVKIIDCLAEKLNYRLLDKEIVEEIAQKTSLLENVLKEMDEAGFTWIEENLGTIFRPGARIPTKDFFKHLCEVVLISASYGQVILIGRGANFILREPEIFRVRIVAPRELRSSRLQEQEKLTLKAAENQVKESDKRRSIFIKSYFKADLNDATLYDLVLNTEWQSPKEAAELLYNAFLVHKANYPA